MKKIKYILLILIMMMVSFNMSVKAVDDDPSTGGGTGSGAEVGGGSWDPTFVGLRVSVLNSSKTLETSKIITNKSLSGSGINLCDNTAPKVKSPGACSWKTSITTYKTSSLLPSSWLKYNIVSGKYDINQNIYNHITDTIQDPVTGIIISGPTYETINKILIMKDGGGNSLFNAGPGDYIIIEPMVKIGNKFGTAYEFVASGDMTATLASSNYGSVFATRTSLLWTTIYLKDAVSGVAALSTAGDDANIASRISCFGRATCGRGIGVFKYNDIVPNRTLYIEKRRKIDTDDKKITGKTATFRVYNGTGCNESNIKQSSLETNSGSGIASIQLAPGEYSIKEITAPNGYERDKNCYNITMTKNNDETLKIYNTPGCQVKADYYRDNLSVKDRIPKLYELYKLEIAKNSSHVYNKLFNLNNPVCSNDPCNSDVNITGCLQGNYSQTDPNNLNNFNFACTELITNPTGDLRAFCNNEFSFNNNFKYIINENPLTFGSNSNTNIFYSKSGRFLISENPTSSGLVAHHYDEHSGNKNLIGTNNTSILNYNQTKTCYAWVMGGSWSYSNIPLTFRFGDNNFDGNADNLIRKDYTALPQSYSHTPSGFFKYIFTWTANYPLNDVYIKKISGKIQTTPPPASEANSYIKRKGILTKFNSDISNGINDLSGIIPFEIEYNYKTYTSNSCKYKLEQEIIEFDPKTPTDPNPDPADPGELELEFRLIDPNVPFNRDTKKNWCGVDAITGDEDCGQNNSTIDAIIFNGVSSYGRIPKDTTNTQQTPKYEITLTADDIKKIIKYNEVNQEYDDYEAVEVTPGVYMNKFVYNLSNGQIDIPGDKSISRLEIN